jgi:LCP family protein required for cell wall assembly
MRTAPLAPPPGRPVAGSDFSPPRPGRRRWVGSLLRRLFGLLFLALLGGGAWLYSTSPTMRDVVKTLTTGALLPSVSFPNQRSVTFLVLGRDRDLDNRGQILKTPGRSDLIMLVRADFENRRITGISIPRDTRVRIPGYSGYHKVNAAHSFGGPRLTMRTVEALTGVRPQHVVRLDFDGFEKAIDAIGGVEVTVDRDMDYDDNWGNLHIHLKKGRQRLNGEQAMGFVRFRHADRGRSDSDLQRMRRQQALLQALRQQVRNPFTLVRAPLAMDRARPHLHSSLKIPQLFCLAAFARGLPQEQVRMGSLPARLGNDFVYADRAAVRQLARQMLAR